MHFSVRTGRIIMTVRRLWAVACFVMALGLLGAATGAGDAEKKDKEPAKQPARSEEQTLTQALDHLRQLGDLVQKLREAESRKKCADNLRQIGLALQAQPPAHLLPVNPPPGAVPGDWANYLLPYIEASNLYGSNRLGISLDSVGEALASHLVLPKGQGLLVRAVPKDSPAEKAGVKPHDVLLEINGKKVPDKVESLAKALDGIKADTAVEVVLLREGKKTTVKNLKLADPGAASNVLIGGNWPIKTYVSPISPLTTSRISDGTSNTILFAERYASVPGAAAVLTTTHRRDDRFTTRYQEGSLIITLTGKIADKKAAVGQIKVQDGGVEKTYTSAEKVPVEYRDKVSDLITVTEKGQDKIEIKK